MNNTISKQTLIDKIEKDLKDKKFDDLKFDYRGIRFDPIYTKEETQTHLIDGPQNPSWEIAQAYILSHAIENNTVILLDLQNGVNALYLDFLNCQHWTEAEFKELFQSIEIKYISLHVRNVPANIQEELKKFLESNSKPVSGSIDSMKVSGYHYPVIVCNSTVSLHQVIENINHAIGEKQTPHLDWEVDTNYFGEIASIRAIKLLWNKMLLYYNDENQISILGKVNTEDKQTEPNSNMIRSTIKAMSAALGGVNAIMIQPHDWRNEKQIQENYRIARNIQLIMQEESGLHLVSDPASGSYFIENLTNQIAKEIWDQFR